MTPGRPARVLAVSILLVAVSTQPVFLLGAAFPRIGPELGFGPSGLGALTAAFFLTAALASTVLGEVVQRIGWAKAMRLNAVSSAVVLVVIAAGARSTPVLAALLVAGAVAYGMANPAANLALAHHVAPERRALLFGLKHAGIPTSTLLAGVAVPAVVVTAGWRWAYVLAALAAAGVLALVPRTAAPPPPTASTDPRRAVAPMSRPRLAALAGAGALATTAAMALGTYLVAGAVAVGFSEQAAGALLAAGSVASIGARVAAGYATDRAGGAGFGGIAALTATGAAVFALLTAASGPAFATLVLAAFATGWAWPGLMTFAVVNANAASAAASSAITQAGIFAGAGLAPLAIGWVVDHHSFEAAWMLVAVALAAAAAITMLVGRGAVRA